MQIPLLHQQIIIQTERLRDLHRSIMMHSSPVPATELEDLLQEIRKLYGLTMQLSNENSLQLLNEIQLAVRQSMPESAKSAIETMLEAPIPSQVEASVQNIPMNTNELNFMKIDLHEPEKSSVMEKDEKPHKKKLADIHEMFNDTATVGNRFTGQASIGNSIVGADSKRRVSDNINHAVKDIKSAIGLNEKFQFINQLFDGDAKKYNAVVDQLNNSDSGESALNYVKQISDEYDWESHASSARLFIDLVERRFSA